MPPNAWGQYRTTYTQVEVVVGDFFDGYNCPETLQKNTP
jgi:hypothetical protein